MEDNHSRVIHHFSISTLYLNRNARKHTTMERKSTSMFQIIGSRSIGNIVSIFAGWIGGY